VRNESLIQASLLVAGLAVSASTNEKLADGQVPFEFTAGNFDSQEGRGR